MDTPPSIARQRELYANRTLNLRSIRAVGYDMDYTLIHYDVAAWERRAYEYLRDRLLADGWPVGGLEFDPEFTVRGLVIDTQLGNLLKANRFGYVKSACHGTRQLEFGEVRRVYQRTVVDLTEPRYTFLNTLFALSEGCMYAQLVDLLDERKLAPGLGYAALHAEVKRGLDATHAEGRLKEEIIAAPDRFVLLDPETPLALLDQRAAGKKLMLITNSEWSYTRSMMSYAFDRYLPDGMTWRDLFEVIVVAARKPEFFLARSPLFEVVNEEGLLRPTVGGLRRGGVYLGGSAAQVEQYLALSGDEVLYVGDHLYGDVYVLKRLLRWRTALILRELEQEIDALEAFGPAQRQLTALMAEKEGQERALNQLQIVAQRWRDGYHPTPPPSDEENVAAERIRKRLAELDDVIAPLARQAGEIGNARWGLLMRAGNDKSYLARQVERHADVYTSRVSNFAQRTPFALLRSPRGSLPHDPA
ncbi:MAG TPA: HAD-IG family 5'-nucleotidase [Polyangia bacterium]